MVILEVLALIYFYFGSLWCACFVMTKTASKPLALLAGTIASPVLAAVGLWVLNSASTMIWEGGKQIGYWPWSWAAIGAMNGWFAGNHFANRDEE